MHIDLITDIPEHRAAAFPKAHIVEWTGEDRRSVDAGRFLEMIEGYAELLSSHGVNPGDRVATYSPATRIAMLAAEFAALRLGAVVCPLHANVTRHDFHAMIGNIGPAFCLVEGKAARVEVEQQCIEPPTFEFIDLHTTTEAKGAATQVERRPEDGALIISTSGTAGKPKGVLLSHGSLAAIAISCTAVVPINRKHIFMSFLPSSHIFERMAVYVTLLQGANIHLAQDPRHGYRLLRKVHPHYFTAVPRILERIFARFHHASSEAGFFRRQIYDWALEKARSGSGPGKTFARWFVMGRLRSLFGVRLKGIIVGGAAMNIDIIRWYAAAGIRVRQGYGLTEVAGVATFNRFTPGEYNMDSVGLPLPGVHIREEKIQGTHYREIVIHSPGLMTGYIIDGALHTLHESHIKTGDLGYIDRKGFLHITGRRKDTFKNSTGQYVSPSRIEDKLRVHPAINQVMVYGLGRPFNVALIVPDFEFLQSWAASEDIHWTAPEYMVHNPEVAAYFGSLIDQTNMHLSQHERLGKPILMHKEWDTDSGMLTSTLKLRRDVIADAHRKVIDAAYINAND